MTKTRARLRGIGDGKSGWIWQMVEETDRGPRVLASLGTDYRTVLAAAPGWCEVNNCEFAYGLDKEVPA